MHKEFRGGWLRAPKILYALVLCAFYLLLIGGTGAIKRGFVQLRGGPIPATGPLVPLMGPSVPLTGSFRAPLSGVSNRDLRQYSCDTPY